MDRALEESALVSVWALLKLAQQMLNQRAGKGAASGWYCRRPSDEDDQEEEREKDQDQDEDEDEHHDLHETKTPAQQVKQLQQLRWR